MSRVDRYSFTAVGPLGIGVPAPILPGDRTLLVGIRLDQVRIDGKAFAANQAGRNTIECAAKNLSLAEALVAGLRERE